jgi:hypothetical protein
MKKLPEHEYSQGVCSDGVAILKDGKPMTAEEIIEELKAGQKNAQLALDFSNIINDLVVGNQSAWIEWQRGGGAEKAMVWVHNGLVGPGNIPDEDEPWSDDANLWYRANKHDPFPVCYCGKPSGILGGGISACCEEHFELQKESKKVDPTD